MCRGGSRRRSRRSYLGRLDAIEFRKILLQIRISLIGDFVLMIGGLIRVTTVQILNYIHSGGYFPEWCEALPALIERAIVAEVDKNLSRTRIWAASLRKRDSARRIGLRHGIVFNSRGLPSFVDRRAAGQSELHNEPGYHAKKFDAA